MERPTHADIYRLLGEIKTTLGSEENGGSCILGRVMKIESGVSVNDRWTQRIAGAVMTATILIGAIWWLVQDKVEKVFK